MNKKVILGIVIAVVVVAAVVVGILVFGNANSAPVVPIATQEEVLKVAEDVYAKIDMNEMPMLDTQVMDLSDAEFVKMYTGLSDASKVEFAVLSQPMMGSMAYSMLLVKVKEGQDVDAIKKEMVDNIDVRRWICVAAEKVFATNHSDLICLVMADETRATNVYNAFKEVVQNKVGTELTRIGEAQ